MFYPASHPLYGKDKQDIQGVDKQRRKAQRPHHRQDNIIYTHEQSIEKMDETGHQDISQYTQYDVYSYHISIVLFGSVYMPPCWKSRL